MNPHQFAIAECANHQPDGSCAGVMIARDLSMPRATPRPRCLLAEGKRCAYFEQCVAPMADWITEPQRAAGLLEAVATYRVMTHQKVLAARPCPVCGGPLAKGRRFCARCAEARRKATYRAAQARCRRGTVLMSTVVAENTPKSPIKQGGILGDFQNPIEDSHPPQNGKLLSSEGVLDRPERTRYRRRQHDAAEARSRPPCA